MGKPSEMPPDLSNLSRAKIDVMLEEYRKINSGIDERVKIVDTLNNISLIIIAGYLTLLGLGKDVELGFIEKAIIAFGVVMMQFFILLQILRNDYLMLNLVEYYYKDLRDSVAKLLLINADEIWRYETFKFSDVYKTKLNSFQFNIFAMMRYSISYFSCILIVIQFGYAHKQDLAAHKQFIVVLCTILGLLLIVSTIMLIRWAFYSVKRSKDLLTK